MWRSGREGWREGGIVGGGRGGMVDSRHWHKTARNEYNMTFRQMAPLISIPAPSNITRCSYLWLGGDNAAADVTTLRRNGVQYRLSMKGKHGPAACNSIADMKPFFIQSVLSSQQRACDYDRLKAMVLEIDLRLEQGRSVLVYCHQGARRAAFLCGVYLIWKTKVNASGAFWFMKELRSILENIVEQDLQAFENSGAHWNWGEQWQVRQMPCVIDEETFKAVATNKAFFRQILQEVLNHGVVWTHKSASWTTQNQEVAKAAKAAKEKAEAEKEAEILKKKTDAEKAQKVGRPINRPLNTAEKAALQNPLQKMKVAPNVSTLMEDDTASGQVVSADDVGFASGLWAIIGGKNPAKAKAQALGTVPGTASGQVVKEQVNIIEERKASHERAASEERTRSQPRTSTASGQASRASTDPMEVISEEPEHESASSHDERQSDNESRGRSRSPEPRQSEERYAREDAQYSQRVNELERQMHDLRSQMAESQAHAVGEEMFNAMSRGDEDAALALLPTLDTTFKWYHDVGGMTLMHKAARIHSSLLVRGLLQLDTECANTPTFITRAPGRWTPLMCLADGSTRAALGVDPEVSRRCCYELSHAMTKSAFATQSVPKGQTFLHLAASKGNCEFMEVVLPIIEARFGKEELSLSLG